jgi:hypothetical protein
MDTIEHLKNTPESFVELPAQHAFSIPLQTLEEIQLAGARRRFSALVDRITLLRVLAEQQGISEIRNLDDLAPLLVPHSAYKSYSLSVLENGSFDRLTRWLDGFTVFDLSGMDASACESIDDWIDLIDATTDIRLIHSSGTSGKLSFLPRSEQEFAGPGLGFQLRLFDGFGDEPGPGIADFATLPVVYPGYRQGAMATIRRLDMQAKYWHRGNGTPIVTLYPGRLSADAMSLGGRLGNAEQRGELGRMRIPPSLLKRRDAMLAEQRAAPARFEAFMNALEALRGRKVYMVGSYAQFHDVAVAAARRDIRPLFSADSVFVIGGGSKGRTLPDDWQDRVREYVGCEFVPIFGMSEAMGHARLCRHGFYHTQPWVIQFLLDPRSGKLLSRRGTQTGRLGLFDLAAWTYWGGFLSGDEVTIHWGDREPCRCGRVGPYMEPEVRRYSEAEGGDDKISCAGAPQAHDRALDYVLRDAGI